MVLRWLRHTAVTRLAEANIATSMIATIAGHTKGSVETIPGRHKVRTKMQAQRAFAQRLEVLREQPQKNK